MAPQTAPTPIDVEFYLDGPKASGELLGKIVADRPSADQGAAEFAGDHGFEFHIPEPHRDGQPHSLHAYALGPNESKSLGSKSFELGPTLAGPASYSIEQLRDLQGDLMLWVPALKPSYVDDIDPVTGIRRIAEDGAVPHGLENGWIWTLTIDRYPEDKRKIIYQAALAEGFTHFAVQVTHCQPGEGYHGLIPVTDADCVGSDERLNQILGELWDHGLIPLCTGVSPTDPVAPGLDKSLCRVVLNDWDNSAQADCHIETLAETFPEAQVVFEIPQGAITPQADRCSPVPFPATGQEWIQTVLAKHPNFFAVAYEVNIPDGLDANQAELEQAHAWWSGVQEIRFEIDTYWKFWDNLDHDVAKQYNDDLQVRVPWLKGFMSGGTTHPPPGR